jgi:hypothetical protein
MIANVGIQQLACPSVWQAPWITPHLTSSSHSNCHQMQEHTHDQSIRSHWPPVIECWSHFPSPPTTLKFMMRGERKVFLCWQQAICCKGGVIMNTDSDTWLWHKHCVSVCLLCLPWHLRLGRTGKAKLKLETILLQLLYYKLFNFGNAVLLPSVWWSGESSDVANTQQYRTTPPLEQLLHARLQVHITASESITYIFSQDFTCI